MQALRYTDKELLKIAQERNYPLDADLTELREYLDEQNIRDCHNTILRTLTSPMCGLIHKEAKEIASILVDMASDEHETACDLLLTTPFPQPSISICLSNDWLITAAGNKGWSFENHVTGAAWHDSHLLTGICIACEIEENQTKKIA